MVPNNNASEMFNSSFGVNHTHPNTHLLPVWSTAIYILLITIIMLIALAGNGIIITVTYVFKCRTSTDWLVLFMSTHDFVMASFGIPVYILIYSGTWIHIGSTALCRVLMFVEHTTGYASTLLLSVTAIDRCHKTCRPHSAGITPKRSKRICIVITIFALVVSCPVFATYEYEEMQSCKFSPVDEITKTVAFTLVYIIQFSFLLMFVTVVVCYCKIAYTIRKKLHSVKPTVDTSKCVHESTANSNAISSKVTMTCSVKANRVEPVHLSEQSDLNYPGPSHLNVLYLTPVYPSEQCEQNDPVATHTDRALISPQTIVENTTLSNVKSNFKDITNNISTDKPVIIKAVVNTTVLPTVNQRLKDRKINRTSVIMFAVTLVFILSWIPPWMTYAIWKGDTADSVIGNITLLFARRSFIINTCTNPLFFVGMSTVFRAHAKQVPMKLRNRFNL